ncbi:hypothetical protein E2C01_097378 [Portunus trituberculatus]|uniref:Uncharacterized protein n=1 Tax=Portunus trituberculatus TaxID=210409 RepID=A0A5B7K098_PORTR|nr:hypothetical protein [Portunus trituberculatus]
MEQQSVPDVKLSSDAKRDARKRIFALMMRHNDRRRPCVSHKSRRGAGKESVSHHHHHRHHHHDQRGAGRIH